MKNTLVGKKRSHPGGVRNHYETFTEFKLRKKIESTVFVSRQTSDLRMTEASSKKKTRDQTRRENLRENIKNFNLEFFKTPKELPLALRKLESKLNGCANQFTRAANNIANYKTTL